VTSRCAPGDLPARCVAAWHAYLALGNERFEAEDAVFVRNRDLPSVRDANHVWAIKASAPEHVERLLQSAEREYAGFPHRCFCTDFATPPQFEAYLVLRGYHRIEALVMALEGDLSVTSADHQIRPPRDESTWEALTGLHALALRETRTSRGEQYDEELAEASARANRMKSPPVTYWLAYVDGKPRAHCSSWLGPEGVGLVEDLFTHPGFRHRGLATALVRHAVQACRAHGAGPVTLMAVADDTPRHMYAEMGFRPVAMVRSYWRPA